MQATETLKQKVHSYSAAVKSQLNRSAVHWLDVVSRGGFSEKQFRKKYFADIPVDLVGLPSVRREFFPDGGPFAWLDRPDAAMAIDVKLEKKEITPDEAKYCRDLSRDGYFIAEGLFSPELLDTMWSHYENARQSGEITLPPEKISDDDPHPGRLLNPHVYIPELAKLHAHSKLMRLASLIFGRDAIAYQTINSHKGSQQPAHSDAIHMTTYPLGYLTACWIAFEDIHPDSGPLFYYPGSHRLPYLLSREAGIDLGSFKKWGYRDYTAKYEPAIQKHVASAGLKPLSFTAKKGDVLFWHANLVHGGSLRKDPKHSRKAMVCHYFAKGAVCYHDLAESLASMKIASRSYTH